MTRGDLARLIVEVVIETLDGRGGFDDWWDGVDDDIQGEITEEMENEVLELIVVFDTQPESNNEQ